MEQGGKIVSLFQNTFITSWQRYTLIPSPFLLPPWIVMIPEKWESCNRTNHPPCAPFWSAGTSSQTAGRSHCCHYQLKEAGKIPPCTGFVHSLIPHRFGHRLANLCVCPAAGTNRWGEAMRVQVGDSLVHSNCSGDTLEDCRPDFLPLPWRLVIRREVTFLVKNSCITTPSIRKYSL